MKVRLFSNAHKSAADEQELQVPLFFDATPTADSDGCPSIPSNSRNAKKQGQAAWLKKELSTSTTTIDKYTPPKACLAVAALVVVSVYATAAVLSGRGRCHGSTLQGNENSSQQRLPMVPSLKSHESLRGNGIPTPVRTRVSSSDSLGPGMTVYLPSENVIWPKSKTYQFFNDTSLQRCTYNESRDIDNRNFMNFESMTDFAMKTAASVSGDISYADAAFSMKASAELTTGFSSEIKTSFHSTNLQVVVAVQQVSFRDTCMGFDNILTSVVAGFKSLPLPSASVIKKGMIIDSSIWGRFLSFMQVTGTHIIASQLLGSSFQQWVSTQSTSKNIMSEIHAKACAETEGTNPSDGGALSAAGCAAYDTSSRQKASTLNTNDLRVVLGGSDDARHALSQEVSKETMANFIASAEKGTEPIATTYLAIWDIFKNIFRPLCTAGSKPDCDNVQRAVLLEAAYKGYKSLGCITLNATVGTVTYQALRFTKPDETGVAGVECWAAKTGCRRTDGDCHADGTQCYAYGATTFDTGAELYGSPDRHFTKVRAKQYGGTHDGINMSCKYIAFTGCRCHSSWSGGLPDRQLWVSGT